MDEEELAAKRAGHGDRDDMQPVEAWGPKEGLYPPAHPKGRARTSSEEGGD